MNIHTMCCMNTLHWHMQLDQGITCIYCTYPSSLSMQVWYACLWYICTSTHAHVHMGYVQCCTCSMQWAFWKSKATINICAYLWNCHTVCILHCIVLYVYTCLRCMWSVHEIYTYVYASVYFVCCLNVLAQYMFAVISLYMIVGMKVYIYT